jgi:hypothetical protein
MAESGYAGQIAPAAGGSDFNAATANIMRILSRLETSTAVVVKAVTNAGEVAPVGYVDVQPLVHQVDGYGKPVPHGVIHHLPYSRIQGGKFAIILDPQVGDVGTAVFASRDISTVKATGKAALPGSGRLFDPADGVFLFGILNVVPTDYVRFSGDGIEIVSTVHLHIQAPSVQIDSTVTVSGDVVAGGISLIHHIHPDPQSGVTGAPE